MNPAFPFATILSAFGLSGAAGLNAYIPLLAVGLLSRFGVLHLSAPYQTLAEPWFLITLAIFALIDFVGDKIPAVDHVLHVIGAVVQPVAGAILFASQTNAVGQLHPAVALACGLIVAGGLHATRMALRPAATTTTAGMANPVLSFLEDASSLLLTLLALFFPIVAGVILIAGIVGVIALWRWIHKRIKTVSATLAAKKTQNRPPREQN